jgi:hypothetical protein
VEFRAFQSLVLLRVGEARAAGDVLKRTIAQTIHPYPIQAEAIRKIGDAYNRWPLTPRLAGCSTAGWHGRDSRLKALAPKVSPGSGSGVQNLTVASTYP